jgi:hypothetical protein
MKPADARRKILVVSDVSLGYGTPQILRAAESFASAFESEVLIIEPDEPERPFIDIRDHVGSSNITLKRIFTTSHPYSAAGRVEFVLQAAREVDAFEPLVILFCSDYGLPILTRIDPKRSLNIFYCLEQVHDRPNPDWRPLVSHCDLIIFPEANRARLYYEIISGKKGGPEIVLLYNTNYARVSEPPEKPIKRLFYGGSFHREMTCASHFLEPKIATMPIDVYGLIRGFDDEAAVRNQMTGMRGGLRYCGYLEADAKFFDLLSRYQYSIVIWNPVNSAQFNAAPNKLFDAIACATPPICAPHPQCVEIVRKWRCGLLLDDWSADALRVRLRQAIRMIGTDDHKELVGNCLRAMQSELAWPIQFEKVLTAVRRRLDRPGQ